MNFAERLKTARLASCNTQIAVCKAVGIAQSSYSVAEKGRSTFRRETRLKVADFLKIEPSWLETGHGSPFKTFNLLELNICKEPENQEAAVDLIRKEHLKRAAIYQAANCLFFEKAKGHYIVLYLCSGYKPETIMSKFHLAHVYAISASEINLHDVSAIADFFHGFFPVANLKIDETVNKILNELSITLPKSLLTTLDEEAANVISEYKELLIKVYERLTGKNLLS